MEKLQGLEQAPDRDKDIDDRLNENNFSIYENKWICLIYENRHSVQLSLLLFLTSMIELVEIKDGHISCIKV